MATGQSRAKNFNSSCIPFCYPAQFLPSTTTTTTIDLVENENNGSIYFKCQPFRGFHRYPNNTTTATTTTTNGQHEEFVVDIRGKKKKGKPLVSNIAVEGPHPILDELTTDDNGTILTQNLLKLHQEIVDFEKRMSGTREDNLSRNKVISNVSKVVDRLWPGSKVELFGSFRTGLHLPESSDIDLVITKGVQREESQKHHDLKELSQALITEKIAEPGSITIVDKTLVPLVKLTERWTGVKVDIIFQGKGTVGVQAAGFIKQLCQEFPELSKLILIIKHLLIRHDRNEVYRGGISSYSLILMLYSLYQACRVSNTIYVNDPLDLGSWLILFFGFYGNFNFDRYGIRVKQLWPFFERPQYTLGEYQAPLCIEDPCSPGNDIGRGSFDVKNIQLIFARASRDLREAVLSSTDNSTCFLDVIFKGQKTISSDSKPDNLKLLTMKPNKNVDSTGWKFLPPLDDDEDESFACTEPPGNQRAVVEVTG